MQPNDLKTVYLYIERKWVTPRHENIHEISELDEEDLARIQLIQELQEDLGVNDDAIPIILNLIDQINCLRFEVKQRFKKSA